jgi:hypothetical protein
MKYGQIVSQILQALKYYGPMTRIEICDALNTTRKSVSAVMTRLNRTSPRSPKRVYVKSYVYDHEGQRYYPRAVYDLGDKPDAKPPGANPVAARKRYLQRKKMLNTANSVFNLALTRKQYVQMPPRKSLPLEDRQKPVRVRAGSAVLSRQSQLSHRGNPAD